MRVIKKSVINIYVMMLIQTVKYNESVIEAEYGNEGYSIVSYERSYSLNRALINGRWIVYRGEKGKDIQQPMKEFEICDSYIHESIKSWIDKDQYLSILDKIDLKEGYNIKLESKKITKVIEIKDIKECIEEKVVNSIKYNDTNFSYTGNPKDIPSIIEYLKGIGTQTPAKNVLTESGKLTFIVDPEILGTVLHYLLADFLNGNMPKFKLNEKILGEITIYDNPLNLFSPSFSVFDDEGVKTKKKEIIGDGIVTNYLGTLTSKYGEPGNARGILPKPDYFSIEVKNGDWSLNELLEESKGSYIAIGSKKSELIKNSIRITPRTVIKIGQGPLFFREIAFPLQDLLTIDAITKETRGVFIDENHGGVLPYVRMKARAMIY